MKYKSYPSEAGIIVEIFLPKKSEYQSTLDNTLKNGMYLDYSKHFLDDDKINTIKELIENYSDISNYTSEHIERYEKYFPNLFAGYSLYEVDGVFKSNRYDNKLYEERTQVIKIFLMPDYDRLSNELADKYDAKFVQEFGRHYLRNSQVDKSSFKKKFKIVDEDLVKNRKDLIEYFSDFVDFAGLFIFGYIVFELCECLKTMMKEKESFRLNENNKLCHEIEEKVNCQSSNKREIEELKLRKLELERDVLPPEEEIWITSVWGFITNKVKFEK